MVGRKITTAAVLCATATATLALTVERVKVGLPLTNTAELDRAFWSISDPQSPEYLQFITSPSDLAAKFGASQASIDAAVNWLVQDLGCNEQDVVVSAMRDTVGCNALVVANATLMEATKPDAVEFVLRTIHNGNGNGDFNNKLVVDKSSGSGSGSVSTQNTTTTLNNNNNYNDADAVAVEHPDPDSFYTIANTKKAYGIPVDLQAKSPNASQMVWGPGTFGYSKSELEFFKEENCPLLNTKKVKFDTANHGVIDGDNFGEGNLDVKVGGYSVVGCVDILVLFGT